LSRATQTQEAAVAEKKSAATPQQLWSAVQSGDSNAAVLLADHYLRGDGVPVNCLQARVLLLVASEKKNPTAIRKLRELDQKGCS
jgi:TPR repeat protein